jgi:hypothetical protein
MNIMSAGVHHADFFSGRVLYPYVTRVAEAGLFDHRQRVHIGADQETRTGSVFEDRNDTVGLASIGILTDALGHGVPGLAEFIGE